MERILYADDDVDIQEIIKGILTKAGYDVTIAKDGIEAVMMAKSLNPDLIILDYLMPAATGLEALKTIKKDPALKSTPVIMVTAYPNEKEESLHEGAVDFINKPVDKTDLLWRIKSVLKVRTIKNELQRVIAYLAELER